MSKSKTKLDLTPNSSVHESATAKYKNFDIVYSYNYNRGQKPEIITVSATLPDSKFRIDGNYFPGDKTFRVSFQGLTGVEDLTPVQVLCDGCEQILEGFQ